MISKKSAQLVCRVGGKVVGLLVLQLAGETELEVRAVVEGVSLGPVGSTVTLSGPKVASDVAILERMEKSVLGVGQRVDWTIVSHTVTVGLWVLYTTVCLC